MIPADDPGATFPAQAILFARVISVFELTGDDLREKGNFFSLMFLIVAIANAVAYAFGAWATNTISQVS
jgi:ATP-binding cassette subfamily B (MDR/TAP) protein 1